MKNSRWRGYAVNLLIFVLVASCIRLWQQRDMVSGAAPELEGVTLSGHSYVLPAHPDRPVLVHFWASWCPVCRTEQGTINEMAKNDSGVISIAMQSGRVEQVSAYMQAQGIDFEALNDPDGKIAYAWGVHAVPATFIISPDGRIRFIEVGYTTGIGLKVRRWLAKF